MATQAHYLSIYRLHNVNALPDGHGRGTKLATFAKPSFEALLTSEPEPHFAHIDRSRAILALWAKQGTAGWTKLDGEIAAVKKNRPPGTTSGVFVVFNGMTEIPNPTFRSRRDSNEFAFSIDDVSTADIRNSFKALEDGVLIALSLSFPDRGVPSFDPVGQAVYLIEEGKAKPIYAYNLNVSAVRVTEASPMSSDAIENAQALGLRLTSAEFDLSRPVSLLRTSLDKAMDELQGFIAAWAAIEIFVNKTFKSTYEPRWYQTIESSFPESAKRAIERIAEVMNDKYRLSDKFLIIASVLDPDWAVTDAQEFRHLKEIRDKLAHGLDIPAEPLPIESVQKLLLKFLRLHLRP
jgi:hypothetical protein